LAGSFETIVLEDLDVAGMVKKSKKKTGKTLRRSIQDAGFYEFRRQLTYKAEGRGHRIIGVNRFYPSSKMCSHCGGTKAKLALNERVFECSNCGIRLDRDVNAARNIRDEGIRLLTNEASTVAGYQPETLNADSRDRQTKPLTRGPLPEQNHAANKRVVIVGIGRGRGGGHAAWGRSVDLILTNFV
jgi:putative transposase